MNRKYIFLIAFVLLPLLYVLGPTPKEVVYSNILPKISADLSSIDKFIADNESKAGLLKPQTEAKIIWADYNKRKTRYSIVYLHGFSATHYEGNPTHINLAKETGCNLYLSRLADHGRMSKNPLLYMTPDSLYNTALEALAIGLRLGDKVILMGTSTGGSLALKLASEFPDKVAGLILYSPNIELRKLTPKLLTKPWGLQIGRLITGSNYYTLPKTAIEKRYWYSWYRLEGIIYLQQFLEDNMNTELFKKVSQPLFCGYYYKDKKEQDKQVNVSRIKSMFDEVGTRDSLKQIINFPNADAHVICSSFKSNDYRAVLDSTLRFFNKHFKL